ncbi:MAG: hypothetical protein M3347_17655 [Armatimonadota bacterium]|nr:hypothetical protein [Armatimonadota bacterium]
MKKIQCPQCAVINLDKFVTYPHCAGCGALLPQDETARETISAWRRPLGALLWATIVGCAAIVAIAVSVLFVSKPRELGQLIVYPQTPRTAPVGRKLVARFMVDAIDTSRRDPSLQGVKLRMQQDFFQNFTLIAITPRPDEIRNFGRGRYFYYQSLPRESQLRLILRAEHPGRHRLKATIYAQQHLPVDYLATIRVLGGLNKVKVARVKQPADSSASRRDRQPPTAKSFLDEGR